MQVSTHGQPHLRCKALHVAVRKPGTEKAGTKEAVWVRRVSSAFWIACRAWLEGPEIPSAEFTSPHPALSSRVRRPAVLALLCFTLAACGPERERADLVFINGAEPESFDPAVVTDQVGMRISSALFEGLCRIDEAGVPGPGMAERWDISADKKHYTFHLRHGATWSNGDPVTAHDFVRS